MSNTSNDKQDKRKTEAYPTEFPKSARPIFVKLGTLLLLIIGLCVIASQCKPLEESTRRSNEDIIKEVPGMKMPYGIEEELKIDDDV